MVKNRGRGGYIVGYSPTRPHIIYNIDIHNFWVLCTGRYTYKGHSHYSPLVVQSVKRLRCEPVETGSIPCDGTFCVESQLGVKI